MLHMCSWQPSEWIVIVLRACAGILPGMEGRVVSREREGLVGCAKSLRGGSASRLLLRRGADAGPGTILTL
ncbi:hypothetical protein MANAM107_09010 [Actinomyces capricornis]|uniref:Secreted protein n=1 Tax=Actinomyces capricornis TaxID=2755559 RepID=A0ABM7U9E5_9ACTO|nr:hypothetical protein MANAM107_09010 [Actinomyces capricornis]